MVNSMVNPHSRFGFDFSRVFKGVWDVEGSLGTQSPDPEARVITFINKLGFALKEHEVSLIGGTIPPFPNFSYMLALLPDESFILVLGRSPILSVRSAIFRNESQASTAPTTELLMEECRNTFGWKDCKSFVLPKQDKTISAPQYDQIIESLAREQVAHMVTSSGSPSKTITADKLEEDEFYSARILSRMLKRYGMGEIINPSPTTLITGFTWWFVSIAFFVIPAYVGKISEVFYLGGIAGLFALIGSLMISRSLEVLSNSKEAGYIKGVPVHLTTAIILALIANANLYSLGENQIIKFCVLGLLVLAARNALASLAYHFWLSGRGASKSETNQSSTKKLSERQTLIITILGLLTVIIGLGAAVIQFISTVYSTAHPSH